MALKPPRTAIVLQREGYTEGTESLVAAMLATAGLIPPLSARGGIGGFMDMETLLTLFWRLWDSAYEKQEMPSPRDVIQIFSLADKLADFETASAAISGRVQAKIGRQHLERALQQFCEAGDAVSC